MGYSFKAKIKNKKSPMTPDEIGIVTFGIRKGEEVEEFKSDKVMAIFESIKGKYLGMMAKDAKDAKSAQARRSPPPKPSPKPLTFSWFKTKENNPVFRNLKGTPLTITITVVDQGTKASWEWTLDDVVLSAPKADLKTFPPDNYQRTDERFDGTFKNFVDK
jgi:hypothetical protein